MGLKNHPCYWDAAYERIAHTNPKNPSNPISDKHLPHHHPPNKRHLAICHCEAIEV